MSDMQGATEHTPRVASPEIPATPLFTAARDARHRAARRSMPDDEAAVAAGTDPNPAGVDAGTTRHRNSIQLGGERVFSTPKAWLRWDVVDAVDEPQPKFANGVLLDGRRDGAAIKVCDAADSRGRPLRTLASASHHRKRRRRLAGTGY